MTAYVGGAVPGNIVKRGDYRLAARAWQEHPFTEVRFESFRFAYWTAWWPRTRFAGDLATDIGVWKRVPNRAVPWRTGGTNSRFGIVGVTRDAYGSVLGSCTVRLFRTSDDVEVDQTTSDPNTGAFLASTPYYPDAHYLVAYKTGSPDVAGTSVNTLIGA